MKLHIAKFNFDNDKQSVEVEFHHPDLTTKPDIQAMLDEFENQCHRIGENEELKFVVIRPEGISDISGQDLYSFLDDELDVRIISKWEKIVVYLERLRKVTIASLHGAIGGTAFQLALACDYRVCAPDTVLKLSSIQSGFVPGMAIFRLAKYIGLGKAKRILFTGKELTSQEALEIGLVDEISDNIPEAIKRFESSIHEKNLEAIIMSRRLLNESFHESYEDQIGDYLAAQVRCYEHIRKIKKNTTTT